MSEVEERDERPSGSSDQGPYTGQSMDMPQEPFQPEDITVLGYDDEGNPILEDKSAEAEVEVEDEE